MLVIPAPQIVRAVPGSAVVLRSGCTIGCPDPGLAGVVETFARDVRLTAGLDLRSRRPAVHADVDVHFAVVDARRRPSLQATAGVDPQQEPSSEWYLLDVGPSGVSVTAGSAAGVARGAAALVQLVATSPTPSPGTRMLEPVRIEDAPAFAWRGLTLDVARRYLELADLARIIDLLALYRLNVLHLHLTDDDGWRVEAGPRPGVAPDDAHYRDGELRRLDRYAADRFVTLVPEVDTPGHAAALVRMHPWLDNGRNVRSIELMPGRPHVTAWLDPAHQGTLALVEEVLTSVADVFSAPFFHIGGDEPGDMPPELYSAFVRRVRKSVAADGKRPIGWQETARAGLGPDDVIQYWIDAAETPSIVRSRAPARSLPPEVARAVEEANRVAGDDVPRALSASAKVLLSPTSHAYLDRPYAEPSSDPEQEASRRRLGMPFLAPSTVEEFWDWDPSIAMPDLDLMRDVAGVSAALWCETVRDVDDVTFLLLPRLPGIAEHAWRGWGASSWSEYRSRLGHHGALWDALDLHWFRSSVVDWTRP